LCHPATPLLQRLADTTAASFGVAYILVQRNVVERLVNRLKQFRRVATRYEKRAVNYLVMLTVAAIVLWL
jgi:transposase